MKAPFYFISPDLPNDHICPAKQMLREEEKPRPTASEGKGGKRDEAQDSHQKSEDTSPKVQVGISSGIGLRSTLRWPLHRTASDTGPFSQPHRFSLLGKNRLTGLPLSNRIEPPS